jgi:hypothetical protein
MAAGELSFATGTTKSFRADIRLLTKLSKLGEDAVFRVYFVERIKTSGSVRNQIAGGFPIHREKLIWTRLFAKAEVYKANKEKTELAVAISDRLIESRSSGTYGNYFGRTRSSGAVSRMANLVS